jgi:hypothetical protein
LQSTAEAKARGSIDALGRTIARENPLLQGIIDRVDFNATTHGQRDLHDDRLSNLIEAISTKRLGLDDVEADIIGRSYEYLIRKFAEGAARAPASSTPRLRSAPSSPASSNPSPAWKSTIPPAALAVCSSSARSPWRKGSILYILLPRLPGGEGRGEGAFYEIRPA